MNNKYKGIFPAFYACYDENNDISPKIVERFTEYLINKGVDGLYVGGSSGECIYQSVEERKLVLEHVVKVAKGKCCIIAHVACNNTKDSMELASHAESLGVDAIASIPPIYFHLPDYAICKYWNDISSAAPNTDFIIYNIPQLAGVSLNKSSLSEMIKNKRVVGVKNSSMPALDIANFKAVGGKDFVVFNGPDEQLISGLAIGADGGIGGTYGVMPELYLEIKKAYDNGYFDRAKYLQELANEVITKLVGCKGNLYAVIKEIIKINEGIDLGGVRPPLPNLIEDDLPIVYNCAKRIKEIISSL